MALKLTEEHWNVIIQFMESQKEFARGQFSGPSGKKKPKNVMGGISRYFEFSWWRTKSVEKWQKVKHFLPIFF